MLPMAIASSGAVSTTPTQNRRVMSLNSGFSSSATLTVRGSRAMPQIGQFPASVRTISGCIGQVYSVAASAGDSGSKAIPHFGQGPGPTRRTSAHIGQTYSRESRPATTTGAALVVVSAAAFTAGIPIDTSLEPISFGGPASTALG